MRILYPGRESNPHFLNENRILSPACLPVPPPGHLLLKIAPQKDHLDFKQTNLLGSRQVYLFLSGRPGSNRLPRPWQGRALPNELLPLLWSAKVSINLKIQTSVIKKIYCSVFFTINIRHLRFQKNLFLPGCQQFSNVIQLH